ncbi:MAG: aryl-sulfate sulfotransferase [Bacteroidetes bacterium]|nr:aryl-sulfate sulfotransferase [Bacteroidota bacterium]
MKGKNVSPRRRPARRSAPLQAMITALLFILLAGTVARAQQPLDGYTLFSPTNGRTTYLIDMQGKTVHTWTHSSPGGYATYLLPDGLLLRPGSVANAQMRGAASSGLIEKIDWSGRVVWSFMYSGPTWIAHHDIEPMPNGNVLLIAWEAKSAAEATAMGRQNAQVMWPDHIVEVAPAGGTGTIVWEWHAWDHLVQDRDPSKPDYGVIAEHPELFNVNLISNAQMPGGGDWLHINGVSYNPEADLIVISSHFMNEIYVIDHSTTTAEAAGHTGGRHGRGGDILYRWGNPANYGAPGPVVFDVVHCSAWVPAGYPGAGNILAFNNAARARASVIVEIAPPLDGEGKFVHDAGQAFGPAVPAWSYSAGNSFFSAHLGGNQRLSNGNTYLTEATEGDFREVAPDGTMVWEYNYSKEVARSLRYPADYSGLAALHTADAGAGLPNAPVLTAWNAPNPFPSSTMISYTTPAAGTVELVLHDALGREVRRLSREQFAPGTGQLWWDGRDAAGRAVSPGIYYYRIRSGSACADGKMIRY